MSENSEDFSLTQAHEAIEEKKTRLWALSFESTKQIVHCAKCGATNVVNRLVEERGSRASRRMTGEGDDAQPKEPEPNHRFRESESEVTQAGKRLLLEAQLGQARQEATQAREKLQKAKQTIAITASISALLSATCLALLVRNGRRP